MSEKWIQQIKVDQPIMEEWIETLKHCSLGSVDLLRMRDKMKEIIRDELENGRK